MFYQLFPFCAAEQVLAHFRDRFIQAVDANAIVYELRHEGIISDGDVRTITKITDIRQQNKFLHSHLQQTCDREALARVCDLLTAVQGYPRMKALGRDMNVTMT